MLCDRCVLNGKCELLIPGGECGVERKAYETIVSELKEAFIKHGHPRFRKEIAATRHMLYGTAAVYAEGVRNASLDRVAKLVRIVGMLLQTKVYLFWSKRLEVKCS
jgi:hypothetical protein